MLWQNTVLSSVLDGLDGGDSVSSDWTECESDSLDMSDAGRLLLDSWFLSILCFLGVAIVEVAAWISVLDNLNGVSVYVQ